jgi:hypothetical protein
MSRIALAGMLVFALVAGTVVVTHYTADSAKVAAEPIIYYHALYWP